MNTKDRIITLQKQLKTAREALAQIARGRRDPMGLAQEALDEINHVQFTKVGYRDHDAAVT